MADHLNLNWVHPGTDQRGPEALTLRPLNRYIKGVWQGRAEAHPPGGALSDLLRIHGVE